MKVMTRGLRWDKTSLSSVFVTCDVSATGLKSLWIVRCLFFGPETRHEVFHEVYPAKSQVTVKQVLENFALLFRRAPQYPRAMMYCLLDFAMRLIYFNFKPYNGHPNLH